MEIAERPAWVDDELFPFQSRFLDLDGHRVHYVDEGSGPTLLFLHGNPTWSFDYSTVITLLREDFRCVAVDYPGFGLSTAAPGYRYLPTEHAAAIGRFVDALGLRNITLVGHDWGGPIGLAVLQHRPEILDRLVLTNTWAWPVSDPLIQVMSHVMGSPIGRLLIRQLNLFVNVMIPIGHRLTTPTSRQMDHYKKALDSPARREASAVFPREITSSRAFLAEIEAGLEDIAALADADHLGRRRLRFRRQGTAAVTGGLLLEHFSWNSVFWALTPPALLAAVLAYLLMPESRDPGVPALDIRGLITSIAMLGILVYTIIEAPVRGWHSHATVFGFVTTGVWRRYDQMPHHPRGLLVLGDALCSLDPINGQGMTMAVLHAATLRTQLRHGDRVDPQAFYADIADITKPVLGHQRSSPIRGDRPEAGVDLEARRHMGSPNDPRICCRRHVRHRTPHARRQFRRPAKTPGRAGLPRPRRGSPHPGFEEMTRGRDKTQMAGSRRRGPRQVSLPVQDRGT